MLVDYQDKTLMEALVKLISITDDSVLLKRSGSFEQMEEIKYRFKCLNLDNVDEITKLNNYCIENDLSFGGSADILITSIYLKKLQEIFSFIEL